ncbi:MAG: hypothetical protein GF364_03555 [Candidatus Lokiarchaeota archaeon]|nr:hypothetical protein [Candidatus Lokiarchaeota archaeon]
MIVLSLNYNPPFTDITNIHKEELEFDDGTSLNDVLIFLSEKYGEKLKDLIWDVKTDDGFHDRLTMIINGLASREKKVLERELKSGDRIWLAHSFFGG